MINDGKKERSIDPQIGNDTREQRINREQLLQAYLDALESCDLEKQDEIAQQAEGDIELEDAIWNLHLTLGAEIELADWQARVNAQAAEADIVHHLAEANLSAPVTATRAEAEALLSLQSVQDAAAEEVEPPQLTLGDVATRLRHNVTLGLVAVRDRATAMRAAVRIAEAGKQDLEEEHLSRRGTRTLLARMGLAGVGAWFEKLFHDAVIDLTMAREQDALRLAAARRSRIVTRSHHTSNIPQSEISSEGKSDTETDAGEQEGSR